MAWTDAARETAAETRKRHATNKSSLAKEKSWGTKLAEQHHEAYKKSMAFAKPYAQRINAIARATAVRHGYADWRKNNGFK